MKRSNRKLLWNVCLGNLFEHYDTALFGFLSPFLAPLIFPEQEAITALLLTYMIIPLGMLARPIGALVFGYIGDRFGREYSLFLTLGGMAIVSASFASVPSYIQVGIWAPILFSFGRVLQNFLAAGETMGGAIFVLENSSEERQDLISSFYAATAVGGHLLASLGVSIVSTYGQLDSGWRLLYLCGAITALFGCLIRLNRPSQVVVVRREPLARALISQWKALLIIAICSGFASATYAIAIVLMNGLIPLISPFTKDEMMKINSYLLILDICLLPFFGWVASKVSREKLMLAASLGTLLLSTPLMLFLNGASLGVVIAVRIVFVMLGVAFFAPFHAWAQQLVPSNSRYAVISFGYALGSQLLGSPTAALSLWCFQKTGSLASIAWYWIFLSAASSLAIVLTLAKKRDTQSLEINYVHSSDH